MNTKIGFLKRRDLIKRFASIPLAGTLALFWPGMSAAKFVDIDKLKPGQFIWLPEFSLTGPISIVISLNTQRVHVYRNGVRIGVSTCSNRAQGPRNAYRRVYDPPKGQTSPLQHIQQRADAQHEPADQERHRPSRREIARLYGITRVYPLAPEVLGPSVY